MDEPSVNTSNRPAVIPASRKVDTKPVSPLPAPSAAVQPITIDDRRELVRRLIGRLRDDGEARS